MIYQVKLETFEGPLDLLLYLIKKNDLDIYEIPISQITAEYLEYLKILKLLNLEVTGDFLVMAATLIHIKSKMLLPTLGKEDGEEIEDPRKSLMEKLLEYKKFKEIAKILEKRELSQRDIFYRESPYSFEGDYVLEVSLFDLLNSFKKILSSTSQKKVKDIIDEEVSVEEKIKEILYKLERCKYVSFFEIFNDSTLKQEVIVTFLALLELIKVGQVFARQIKVFGNIRIYKKRGSQLKKIEKETIGEKDKGHPEIEQFVKKEVNYNLPVTSVESEGLI